MGKDLFKVDSEDKKGKKPTKTKKRKVGSEGDDELSVEVRRAIENMDNRQLLELCCQEKLSSIEKEALLRMMNRQNFVGIAVNVENISSINEFELRTLHKNISKHNVNPSGVVREVPSDGNQVATIAATNQDIGIGIELQFNTIEGFQRIVDRLARENEDMKRTNTTWYKYIQGCCHRYLDDGGFWKKYDILKYDFDVAPKLHFVFYPKVTGANEGPSYNLLATWPCRNFKGEKVYQRFTIRLPGCEYVPVPIIETLTDRAKPDCHCSGHFVQSNEIQVLPTMRENAVTKPLPPCAIPELFNVPISMQLNFIMANNNNKDATMTDAPEEPAPTFLHANTKLIPECSFFSNANDIINDTEFYNMLIGAIHS